MTDQDIIQGIISREGGYVNNPADIGQATNMGVTIATLASWRGHPVTAADVEALTMPEATLIYQNMYIDAPGFSRIVNDTLRVLLIDTGVLFSPERAVVMLQSSLGIPQDGIFGPQTLATVQGCADVVQRMGTERLMTHFYVAGSRPDQVQFLKGWVARTVSLLQ